MPQCTLIESGPGSSLRRLQVRKWRALSSALHAHQYGCFVPDLTRFPGRACEGTRQGASIGKMSGICKKLLLGPHETVLPLERHLPEVIVFTASLHRACRRFSRRRFPSRVLPLQTLIFLLPALNGLSILCLTEPPPKGNPYRIPHGIAALTAKRLFTSPASLLPIRSSSRGRRERHSLKRGSIRRIYFPWRHP